MNILGKAQRIQFSEVFFRDGLQAFEVEDLGYLTTNKRREFIEKAVEAGVSDIEVTSFSHPRVVPQFADAEEVVAGLPTDLFNQGIARVVAPNLFGLKRAATVGVRHVTCFMTCSERYQEKNVGMSIDETLKEIEGMVEWANRQDIEISADVGTAFVCPFEGNIDPSVVHHVVGAMESIGIESITVADTLGMADPGWVYRLFRALSENHDVELGAHLHNRHGVASVGVLAAIDGGAKKIDGSLLGVGAGTVMPVDKMTMGNVPSEEVVFVLNSLGIETGVDFRAIRELALVAGQHVDGVTYPRITSHGSVEDYVDEYV